MIVTARPARDSWHANGRQTATDAPKTALAMLEVRLIAVFALAKVAFHLATATLWGFHPFMAVDPATGSVL